MLQRQPDVILAAECVCFEPAFPLLLQTLKDLLALNPQAVIYFCFKKRRRANLRFVKMAKKAFVVQELPDQDRPVFERQQLFLFSLRSRPAGVAGADTDQGGRDGRGSGKGGGRGWSPLAGAGAVCPGG